jgi:environmental stress-induced protein Ves
MMRCTLLPSFEYRRERWRNGLGWTREIHSDAAESWGLRCSVAEIDQDGAFSRFPGMHRDMVLLQGAGLRLLRPDAPSHELLPPHGRASYSGEDAVSAELIDGPCHALNLIHDPSQYEVELLHRPLVGPMVFFIEPSVTWLIYVLSGHAADKQQPKGPAAAVGDSLLLSAGEDSTGGRCLIDGGGELLLLRLRTRPPARGEAPSAP